MCRIRCMKLMRISCVKHARVAAMVYNIRMHEAEGKGQRGQYIT